MTKVCRTCLIEVEDFKNVFTEEISGMLSCITGLMISVGDGLPEIVCLDCTKAIKNFYDFREKCHKSYKILQSLKTEVHYSESVNGAQNFEKNTIKIEENDYVSCKNEFPDLENDESKSDDEYVDIYDDSQVKIKSESVTKKTDTIIEKKLTKKNGVSHHCDVCSIIVENSKILKRHRETHDELNPRNYICELCHDAFYEKSKLIRHKRRHENLKKYTCEKCKDQFYDIGALVRHTEAIHAADSQPIQCTLCNESFILERQYDHHMKKAHGVLKEYRCFQCNEIFTLPKMLLKHENTHKYGRPYPCSLCSAAFQNSKSLKHHLKWHAGEGLQYIVCSFCGKQVERYRITKHMKIHEKPFKCKICPRACAEKWELVNHMRIHTGEKRFICNFCGVRFSASQTLKKHLLIHTGEKPHVCTICGHAFRQHGTLKTHMKVHR